MYPLQDRTSRETAEVSQERAAEVVSALARAYTLSDTFPLHHPRVSEAIHAACVSGAAAGIVALDVREDGFRSPDGMMADPTGRLGEFARGLSEAQVEHLRIDGNMAPEAIALFLFCVRQVIANRDVRIADVLACAGAHSIRVAVAGAGGAGAQPSVEHQVLQLNASASSVPAAPQAGSPPQPSGPSEMPGAPSGGPLPEPPADWDMAAAVEFDHAVHDTVDWGAGSDVPDAWEELYEDAAQWTDPVTASDAEAFAPVDPFTAEPPPPSDETHPRFATPELESGQVQPDLGQPEPLVIEQPMSRFEQSSDVEMSDHESPQGRDEAVQSTEPTASPDSLIAPDPLQHVHPPVADPEDFGSAHERNQAFAPREADTAPLDGAASESSLHESDDAMESPQEPARFSGDHEASVTQPHATQAGPGDTAETDLPGEPNAADATAMEWVEDDLWVTDHWQAEEFRRALMEGTSDGNSDPFAGALQDTRAFDARGPWHAEEEPLPAADLGPTATPVSELAPEPSGAESEIAHPVADSAAPPEATSGVSADVDVLGSDHADDRASEAPPETEAPVQESASFVDEVMPPAESEPSFEATAITESVAAVEPDPTPKQGVDPEPLVSGPIEMEQSLQPSNELLHEVHGFIGADDRDRPEIEHNILAMARAADADDRASDVVNAIETLLYQTPASDRGADSLARVMVTDAVVEGLMERLGEARDDAARDRLKKVSRRVASHMAPALAEALNAVPPRSVRRNYLDALCTMGEDAHREAVAMLQDSRWFIVRNGVDVLGEVGGEESVSLLVPVLNHIDQRVRVATVRAMAKVGGEEGQINLTRALRDESRDVREAAAMAVGHLRAERALRPLLGLLDREKDEEFQLVLIRSLGQLGALDAVPHLEKRATGGLLFKPSKAVRIAAYRALAAIGSPRARQLLMDAAADRDHEVATAARSILARMAPAAVPQMAG